jgi:hypothetical protein
MKFQALWMLAALLLAACQSSQEAPKPTANKPELEAEAEGEKAWQPSSLSEQTIERVGAIATDYQKCLNGEIMAGAAASNADPRAVTDTVLRKCEAKLGPMKAAFDAEKVPDDLSNRYLRKTRTQGARNVLKFVMSAQALRAADEASRKIDERGKQP